jgi:hypothetical protein
MDAMDAMDAMDSMDSSMSVTEIATPQARLESAP